MLGCSNVLFESMGSVLSEVTIIYDFIYVVTRYTVVLA